METNIKIVNAPQIRRAFAIAPKQMAYELAGAIKKSTFLVEGRSKIKTPVRTGFLRNSHMTRFMGGGLHFQGTIEPTAQYAIFVHEGTRFMRGRPFLREAMQDSDFEIQRLFVIAVQNVLNQIGRMV